MRPTQPGDPTSPRLQRKHIVYLGRIDVTVNFVHGPRARGEVITLDVVDNTYKYNVIFGRRPSTAYVLSPPQLPLHENPRIEGAHHDLRGLDTHPED
uniref:Uncharacterized protein n=1 Tax=Oryza barthii TaxID=65489 RepID=A0A0D3HM13_9ORYZ